jgi:Prokaryotic E2 family A
MESTNEGFLQRAMLLISKHPAITNVSDLTLGLNSRVIVDVTFHVNLPHAWLAKGRSPNGVLVDEIVRFSFPAKYPFAAPEISLRSDFDRNLAHIQPWLDAGRPVPCIYDGPLLELLHSQGLRGILNQTALWLDHAAVGQLIDPEQGWEPVRRDVLKDYVVADAQAMRSLVNRDGGYRFFQFSYLKFLKDSSHIFVNGEISSTPLELNLKTVSALFEEYPLLNEYPGKLGRSIALLVWPGKKSSGGPLVTDEYFPETVVDVGSLMTRAQGYGCGESLRTALSWFGSCTRKCSDTRLFTMAILLCARRPHNLIGTDSPIELCPYVLDAHLRHLFIAGDRTPVRPAGHRDRITPLLLRRMSGEVRIKEALSWSLIGCGSLGSKIAVHLARAGRAPSVVVDKSVISPHNAARHVLLPAANDLQLGWAGAKAQLLADALEGLGQKPTIGFDDIVETLASDEKVRTVVPRRTWALLNATASLNVREAIAATSFDRLPPRVIETCLYAGGQLGLLLTEGPHRNPNIGDLIAEMYTIIMADPPQAALIFGSDDRFDRTATGQGCGSMTMKMSDGRLSLFAAGMAEIIAEFQRNGLPSESGRIMIGALTKDGFSVLWTSHDVQPPMVVTLDQESSWRVRVSRRAHEKIVADIGRWPGVETGGILVGRISEAAQTVYVMDILPAPEDSIRSPSEFVLGTNVVRARLAEFCMSCGYNLYCVGTWHNHLGPMGPSQTDRATAMSIALARLTPSALLISTPRGYRALLATNALSIKL